MDFSWRGDRKSGCEVESYEAFSGEGTEGVQSASRPLTKGSRDARNEELCVNDPKFKFISDSMTCNES